MSEYTAHEILSRLGEAAVTLRRMPPDKGPAGHKSTWPEWLRDAWFRYNTEVAAADLNAKTRIQPSAEDIDRMDEAIPWLQLIDQDEAKILWARVQPRRVTWGMIARKLGVSERTARRRTMEIALRLSRRVNGRSKKVA